MPGVLAGDTGLLAHCAPCKLRSGGGSETATVTATRQMQIKSGDRGVLTLSTRRQYLDRGGPITR